MVNTTRYFLKLSRPGWLVYVVFLYSLGVAIADFLGTKIDPGLYILGQAWITLIQLSAHYLYEYFETAPDNPTNQPGENYSLGAGKLPRPVAFWSAIVCLAVAASLSVLILRITGFNLGVIILLALFIMGALAYAIPPFRLSQSGYGELVLAAVLAYLVPGIAFLLQYGDIHRLVSMSTFPLILFQIAMFLAFELSTYAADLKFNRCNLLIRLGWEKGMLIHNLLIVMAFLLIALAFAFGLPLNIGLPLFLALPVGAIQIIHIERLRAGFKPNWPILRFTAVFLIAIVLYLEIFTFWIR